MLAGGLGVFIARRVRETRRDFERELRSEAEAHAARTLAMQRSGAIVSICQAMCTW